MSDWKGHATIRLLPWHPPVRSFFEKRQPAQYRRGTAVFHTGKQRGANPGRIAYRDPVDGAGPVIIDLPKGRPYLYLGAEVAGQGVEEFDGLPPQAQAESSGILVSLTVA